MIYILVFLLSIFFAYFANVKKQQGNSLLFYVFSFLCIAFPVILAGARDYNVVGTDSSNYYALFERAAYARSFTHMLAYNPSDMEMGFQYIVFLISRITSDSFVFFSVIQCLIIVPVYVALHLFPVKLSPSLGMFVYLFLFYNTSLNILRQCVALSFFLLAIVFLIKRSYIKYWIVILACFFIHRTAIIGVPVFLFYLMSTKYPIRKNLIKNLLLLALLSVISFVILQNTNLINAFVSQREVYSNYLNAVNESSISLSSFLLYLYILFRFHMSGKLLQERTMDFFLFMSFCAVIVIFLTIFGQVMSRFVLYFTITYVFSIPYVYKCVSFYKKSNTYHSYNNTLLYEVITLFCLMWYFSIILRGSNATYPYVSIFI